MSRREPTSSATPVPDLLHARLHVALEPLRGALEDLQGRVQAGHGLLAQVLQGGRRGLEQGRVAVAAPPHRLGKRQLLAGALAAREHAVHGVEGV